MNNNYLELINKFAREIAKHGGTCYYVGGYVRDKIMGIDSKDCDIEIHNITPELLISILSIFGKVNYFGKSFGVYHLDNYDIDFALPRTEIKNGDSHVNFDITVSPNLGTYYSSIRRDFTINSIMQNVLTLEIVDHFGGIKDLENKIIRHINDSTFVEDPLRVLRACQFASRFNFTISDQTINLCKTIDVTTLSKERVFEELKKALLKSNKPSIFFEYLDKMEKLDDFFPEIKALQKINQSPIYHKEGNVWNHTMLVLDCGTKYINKVSNPLSFMLSLLCHDLGKAVCTKDENGKITSLFHSEEGVNLAEKLLKRITNEKMIINYVKNMVLLHMKPNLYIRNKAKQKAFNKLFFTSINPLDLLYVARADNEGRITENYYDYFNEQLEKLKIYNEVISKPYVTGKDLLENGISESKEMKELLDFATSLRLSDVNKKNALKQVLNFAKQKIK